MSSTSINIGINEDNRVSSRVLKPPGGGHSNIFGPPEENRRAPRSKNNQQNSTMMGEIMGKPFGGESKGEPMSAQAPASAPAAMFEDVAPAPVQAAEVKRSDAPFQNSTDAKEYTSTRGRVPPGGFSAGLW